jgi:2-oxo-hept-3-ene-1,7-dioate hydratase
MTIEDGYAVSRAWVAMKIAEGRKVRGHKIGLTSRAMQLSSQIDEPDYGTLLDDMFFEPGDIPAGRFIAPRVEVELAFILKRRLQGAQVSVETCWKRPTTCSPPSRSSTPASSSSTATPRPCARCSTRSATTPPMPASSWAAAGRTRARLDLPWVGAILRHNGVVEETGAGRRRAGTPRGRRGLACA